MTFALHLANAALRLQEEALDGRSSRPFVHDIRELLLALRQRLHDAPLLVEQFPVRIRYSIALQLGNGWIGGFAPFVATAVVITTGNIFGGLWYTVAFAGLTAIIGALFLPETRGRDLSK